MVEFHNLSFCESAFPARSVAETTILGEIVAAR